MLLMFKIMGKKRKSVLGSMNQKWLFKFMILCHPQILNQKREEKRRKERDSLANKLEIAENEAAIAEMNNMIKFLEIAKKQSVVMPKDNVDQDTNQVPLPFLSFFSQKVVLNKPLGDASTSNANDNVRRNVPYHPRIDLKKRQVQLEGYRQICFDGIPSFPNPIPKEMRKRLPKFSGNNVITCEDN